MKHSIVLNDFLKFLIVLTCIAIVVSGFVMTFGNEEPKNVSLVKSDFDSSYSSKITKTDSTDKARQSTTTENVTKKVSNPSKALLNTTPSDARVKGGYNLIFLGVILLIVFYALPSLSEFSFLQLFSAKFKAEADAAKVQVNDATNAANSIVPAIPPDIEAKIIKTAAESVAVDKFVVYSDDPQKAKWGGKAENNERKMTASVNKINGNNQLFKVVIKVISTNPSSPLRNFVIFHLHPTFPNPNPKIYVVDGTATLELIAWGAFTVGAEADLGSTELELDLAALLDAPELFKSR